MKSQQWLDYNWQIKNRLREAEELEKFISLTPSEKKALKSVKKIYPVAVTPYYLSLADPKDPDDPIRKQVVPVPAELDEKIQLRGEEDPFKEEGEIKGLTHRYPDRVLMVVTTFCAVYCRHCMRKRIFSQGEKVWNFEELKAMIDYIKSREEIKEVIISGGDPLTLNNEKLEFILKELRRIKHVEIIRLGTRLLVTAPQRFFDDKLLDILEKYSPIWINTHFNHSKEITELSQKAVERLLRRGIPVNNQAVLLKGINDDPETILKLMRNLLRIKVKPLYLFHCDPVKGVMHFRTTIEKGLEIMDYLRGRISGMGIPTYALDLPGGKGKVPLLPNYCVKNNKSEYVFKSIKGEEVSYPV